ncbi:MAG: alpha-ketoacid dehydrogenase subunit beta [Actinobacteria bacterium]|nr:alpha-ketoacid dehydrogenase subunit beta [Actinomycetota bacterium]MCG2789848.1 alpha-ketoacid dehydrogenase subunit beta [Actinomycetes bacterium]
MSIDNKIILMGEDIGLQGGVFGTSRGLYEKYGASRVMDTPISENSFVGAAIGAALTGLRPVVEIMYIDFITLAMDQIVNQAAKIKYMFGGKAKVPIVIRTQGGGGKGNASHHSQSLEVFFCHIPGLKVVMPSTPYDAKGLLKSSIRDDNAIIFIEHKLLYNITGSIPDSNYTIPLGKADIKKEGEDISVVSISYMVNKALSAAASLEDEGISPEVIDLRSLYPLDIDTIISSVKKTNHLLIVHESCSRAGTGAYILKEVLPDIFDYLDSPPVILGGLDSPIPYSYVLESAIIPSEEKIVNTIKKIMHNLIKNK